MARMRLIPAVLLLLVLAGQARSSSPAVVLYTIGEGSQEAWTLLSQSLGAKGFSVNIVKGETDIDRHVDKISRINSIQGAVFLAVEIVHSGKGHAMVAETNMKKGEGRFLSITEISSRYSQESDRLAACVAAALGVGVTHLPLFPLLGVSMPGIAVKLDVSEGDETVKAASKIADGIEKYFSERTGR